MQNDFDKACYIVMGVSGSGKSTVARRLASALEIPFYDADDFHPKANIEKMNHGIPLDDHDRYPWLETLAEQSLRWKDEGFVLACSALKRSYREILSRSLKDAIQWVYLKGDLTLIRQRIEQRRGHFFDPVLLQSQFDTLEEPETAIFCDISKTVDQIIYDIINH